MPDDEALEAFRANGVGLMFDEIKQTLRDFRVPFDVYFHENDLYESGATDRALARLRELGNIYEADGAALAAHREVRRRQGPRDRQERRSRLPTSPATRRTTSTSGSAGSSAASSCSAPTTTATSVG